MNIAVVGAQWGDEGKGKIVDFLAEQAKVVVRFSGGANAGHTIQAGGQTYKLHLVPSGIIHEDKLAVLGTGMVIDPEALFAELETIEKQGVKWQGRIWLSDRAHIVLPSYKAMDKAMEARRLKPLGTTGRGIGVSYAMKAQRDGLRAGDIFTPVYDTLPADDKIFLEPFRERLKTLLVDLPHFLRDYESMNVLFEGAQGVLLDLDLGTYPYVSSGNSSASGACSGGGIGPRHLDKVYGVFKAYSTRVGNGPFPSEFLDERDGNLGHQIREIGNEYGVTTGRPRRCGYLDLVALRYACWTNSFDSLVLTHPDVYDGFDEIFVCTAYRVNGEESDIFPSTVYGLEKAEPVLKRFPGWKKSLGTCTSFEGLPAEALDYVKFIEEYTQTPIEVLSVGPDRNQTFFRKQPWIK